ncbi:swi snf and rsc complex subunit ssr3 [Moniliophthora roreri MCA 2997]|uniref:Swi snf and rsc complex subunit ssr3 n=1 Tax=Moniliophthora roreri (strain MCA 2997) TaxID=1381753 RepID=V2WTZ7_MONRO|nr:swi snf and rsc complex subunit ssr3 [Moniliophthora roreri MCA 2997]
MDLKSAKRRKLTDKSLPNVILQNPEFAEDSKMYQSLLDMERKLDWTMTRKRVEIQDTLSRNPMTTRTLRIFLGHTVSGQTWQAGSEGNDNLNPETGEGIPAWQFKVEGRLLELPNQRAKDKVTPRKFSTFIKKMVIDFDRDPKLYPESNIVEWPRATGMQNPAMDGFTVRRTGDEPITIRLVLYLDHYPEQFKVAPELSNILGIKEESRLGVIQALWNYIKIQGLQDKVDKRAIHTDDRLRPLFGADTVPFARLPEFVTRFLSPPEPVVLMYQLDPSMPPPERPMAYDVEVKTEDTAAKNRMGVLIHPNKETTANIAKMDEEIAVLAQSLHNSHLKRTFLQSFAKDPALFIQTWLESQSKDLETILGSGPTDGMTVRQEELRRSEFFRLPWVEEAVAVQEGYRLANLKAT